MPLGPDTDSAMLLAQNMQDSMNSAVLGNLAINIVMSGSL